VQGSRGKILRKQTVSRPSCRWEDNIKIGLTLLKPSDYLRTTRFNIQQFYIVLIFRLCVLYGSRNKLKPLPYTSL